MNQAGGDDAMPRIRMVIGQIADYRRFIPSNPTCKVLLPEAPTPELLELLWSQRISVMVRGSDEFTELLPSDSAS